MIAVKGGGDGSQSLSGSRPACRDTFGIKSYRFRNHARICGLGHVLAGMRNPPIIFRIVPVICAPPAPLRPSPGNATISASEATAGHDA